MSEFEPPNLLNHGDQVILLRSLTQIIISYAQKESPSNQKRSEDDVEQQYRNVFNLALHLLCQTIFFACVENSGYTEQIEKSQPCMQSIIYILNEAVQCMCHTTSTSSTLQFIIAALVYSTVQYHKTNLYSCLPKKDLKEQVEWVMKQAETSFFFPEHITDDSFTLTAGVTLQYSDHLQGVLNANKSKSAAYNRQFYNEFLVHSYDPVCIHLFAIFVSQMKPTFDF